MMVTDVIKGIVRRMSWSIPMDGVTDAAAGLRGQAASDLIKSALQSDQPCLICRFGSNELNIVVGYCYPQSLRNYWRYFSSQIPGVGWSAGAIRSFVGNAGFFPGTEENLMRFAEMTLADVRDIDILGTWLKQEQLLNSYLSNVKKIPLQDLEPYFHRRPWTEALTGKKVLVIHPFEESIRLQYRRRHVLFDNPNVLPDFELVTIKAVQSIANNRSGYATWFDALDAMKIQVEQFDFDVAILGCGAYGFPLAAHIKRCGKKAVHIGGATQLLFGIKGSRWEEREFYRTLFNENWIRPLPSDHPSGYEQVENGCYW